MGPATMEDASMTVSPSRGPLPIFNSSFPQCRKSSRARSRPDSRVRKSLSKAVLFVEEKLVFPPLGPVSACLELGAGAEKLLKRLDSRFPGNAWRGRKGFFSILPEKAREIA